MQARQVLHKLLQKVCAEMHKLRRTALFVNDGGAARGSADGDASGARYPERGEREALYQARRSLVVESPLVGRTDGDLCGAHAAAHREQTNGMVSGVKERSSS